MKQLTEDETKASIGKQTIHIADWGIKANVSHIWYGPTDVCPLIDMEFHWSGEFRDPVYYGKWQIGGVESIERNNNEEVQCEIYLHIAGYELLTNKKQ